MVSMFTLLLILIANFRHATTLNTYTSNDTHWESSSDFIPSQNTSYGNITLHHAVQIEFDFIYYGKTTTEEHENVFRIGYGGDDNKCAQVGTRYPAMWIVSNDRVQITISRDTDKSCWDNNSGKRQIQKYQKYHMFIKFNQTWKYASISNDLEETYILIDEMQPLTFQSPISLVNTPMNIWLSTKHDPAPNITLSNINIKTWNPITRSPTNNPSITPTTSPSNIPTTSSTSPTQIPSFTPTYIPSISPSYIPSAHPSENPVTSSPSITPSISPSTKPTIDPTTFSTNPTHIPSFTPSYKPTQTEINAREPTINPIDEGHIFETTVIRTSDINKLKSDSTSWIGSFNSNSITLIIPIVIGFFVFVICCFMLFCCKRYNLQIHKSLSPRGKSMKNNSKVFSPKSINNNIDDEEDDIIFSKIYNKQKQLNMETQKQKQKHEIDINTGNSTINSANIDILLPNEESYETSSNEAEEMYIPQTHPSTITATQQQQQPQAPITMEKSDKYNISLQEYNNNNSSFDSIKNKKSFSFNKSKKNRSYSHQISNSHSMYSSELELQHQVTLAISNRSNNNSGEGLNTNNNNIQNNINHTININNININLQHEHGSDSDSEEEDDDIDIYNGDVAPPSSGALKYIYNRNNISNNSNSKKISNKNRHAQLVMSHSATPEMELYGKGNKISNGVDFDININSSNSNDIQSNDSLYIKPNNKYLETPTKNRRNSKAISELYDQPLYMEKENTEGSDDYEWIQQSLKICDPIDWEKYLNNFKKNKVSDFRLNQLTENDWPQLIPTIGPRNYFKQLWFQYEKQTANSMHL